MDIGPPHHPIPDLGAGQQLVQKEGQVHGIALGGMVHQARVCERKRTIARVPCIGRRHRGQPKSPAPAKPGPIRFLMLGVGPTRYEPARTGTKKGAGTLGRTRPQLISDSPRRTPAPVRRRFDPPRKCLRRYSLPVFHHGQPKGGGGASPSARSRPSPLMPVLARRPRPYLKTTSSFILAFILGGAERRRRGGDGAALADPSPAPGRWVGRARSARRRREAAGSRVGGTVRWTDRGRVDAGGGRLGPEPGSTRPRSRAARPSCPRQRFCQQKQRRCRELSAR